MDGQDKIIDPAIEPELFLKWAHRALTGTYIRASKVEGVIEPAEMFIPPTG
jgi:hypothetical protein